MTKMREALETDEKKRQSALLGDESRAMTEPDTGLQKSFILVILVIVLAYINVLAYIAAFIWGYDMGAGP